MNVQVTVKVQPVKPVQLGFIVRLLFSTIVNGSLMPTMAPSSTPTTAPSAAPTTFTMENYSLVKMNFDNGTTKDTATIGFGKVWTITGSSYAFPSTGCARNSGGCFQITVSGTYLTNSNYSANNKGPFYIEDKEAYFEVFYKPPVYSGTHSILGKSKATATYSDGQTGGIEYSLFMNGTGYLIFWAQSGGVSQSVGSPLQLNTWNQIGFRSFPNKYVELFINNNIVGSGFVPSWNPDTDTSCYFLTTDSGFMQSSAAYIDEIRFYTFPAGSGVSWSTFATPLPTSRPTSTPTATPTTTMPTVTPTTTRPTTFAPTNTPITKAPTRNPTEVPTKAPTSSPTHTIVSHILIDLLNGTVVVRVGRKTNITVNCTAAVTFFVKSNCSLRDCSCPDATDFSNSTTSNGNSYSASISTQNESAHGSERILCAAIFGEEVQRKLANIYVTDSTFAVLGFSNSTSIIVYNTSMILTFGYLSKTLTTTFFPRLFLGNCTITNDTNQLYVNAAGSVSIDFSKNKTGTSLAICAHYGGNYSELLSNVTVAYVEVTGTVLGPTPWTCIYQSSTTTLLFNVSMNGTNCSSISQAAAPVFKLSSACSQWGNMSSDIVSFSRCNTSEYVMVDFKVNDWNSSVQLCWAPSWLGPYTNVTFSQFNVSKYSISLVAPNGGEKGSLVSLVNNTNSTISFNVPSNLTAAIKLVKSTSSCDGPVIKAGYLLNFSPGCSNQNHFSFISSQTLNANSYMVPSSLIPVVNNITSSSCNSSINLILTGCPTEGFFVEVTGSQLGVGDLEKTTVSGIPNIIVTSLSSFTINFSVPSGIGTDYKLAIVVTNGQNILQNDPSQAITVSYGNPLILHVTSDGSCTKILSSNISIEQCPRNGKSTIPTQQSTSSPSLSPKAAPTSSPSNNPTNPTTPTTANSSTTTPSTASPSAALHGAALITVKGINFSKNPLLIVGSRQIKPISKSHTLIIFALPEGIGTNEPIIVVQEQGTGRMSFDKTSISYRQCSSNADATTVDCSCSPSFYADSTGACVKCPTGANCEQPGTKQASVNALPGYFLGADQLGAFFGVCPTDTCLGMRACATGYQGIDCTTCADGYSRSSTKYECRQSSSSPEVNQTTFALACMLPLVLSGIYVGLNNLNKGGLRKSKQNFGKPTSTVRKIIISGVQLNAIAVLMQFQFPSNLMGALNIQDSASSIGGSLISFDCLLSGHSTSSFFLICIFYLVLPLLVPLVAVTDVFLYWLYKRLRFGHTGAPGWNQIKLLITTFCITLLFLILPSTTSAAFRNLSCVRLGANSDDLFLDRDHSVRCYSPEHMQYIMKVTVPTIGLWVVGIPLAGFLVLVFNRKKLEDPSFQQKYEFLYEGYNKKHYWWEIVITARKSFMSITAVLMVDSVRMRSLLSVAVIFVAFSVQLLEQPFATVSGVNILNYTEEISLLCSLVIFFTGLSTQLGDTDAPTTSWISGLIMLIATVVFLIWSAISLIICNRLEVRARKDLQGNSKSSKWAIVQGHSVPSLAAPKKWLSLVQDLSKSTESKVFAALTKRHVRPRHGGDDWLTVHPVPLTVANLESSTDVTKQDVNLKRKPLSYQKQRLQSQSIRLNRKDRWTEPAVQDSTRAPQTTFVVAFEESVHPHTPTSSV